MHNYYARTHHGWRRDATNLLLLLLLGRVRDSMMRPHN
jgi:hypothetical protein